MNVMLYVRPKSETFFREVAMRVFDNPSIITFSDYNRIADFWAGKFLYSDQYDKTNQDFEKVVSDILPRCRTLRKMDSGLARKLANRYWNGMSEFFEKNKIDYLITMPVDCYSLDIICRVAEIYGVRVISFLGSPFANHAKITLRGEYKKVRESVSKDEVNHFVQLMTQEKYLSPSEVNNVKKKHSSIYKFFYRRVLIEYIYYPLRKWIDNDPWNYHYNIFEVKGKRFKNVYSKKFEKYFTHIYDLKIDKDNTVYYPMHLVPEATTDYWNKDIQISNYNQFVLNMISSADPNITFIIKEHPAMYGRRELSFYEELINKDNVVLVHPMDRSNNLLMDVDNVVVDNGTVGIEALMRGKRVLCLSENYYQAFHPNAFPIDRVTSDALHYKLNEFSNYQFMENLLQGCFVSDFHNSTNGIPRSNVDQVVEGIREYMEVNNLECC